MDLAPHSTIFEINLLFIEDLYMQPNFLTKYLFKSLPLPDWLHSTFRICFTLFLAISLPVLSVMLSMGVYSFVIEHQPVPHYQKAEVVSLPIICENIKDIEMRKLCFSSFRDRNSQIDLDSLKPGCETLGCGCRYCDAEDIERIFSLHPRCGSLRIDPAFKYYCRALVENPHYCKKITIVDEFIDHWSQDECYIDAALAWKDPLLCERVTDVSNRDFCYLHLIKELGDTH